MSNPIQAFIELKEKRLEALIRGGLLKREDAYNVLCGFADTVRQGICCYKECWHSKIHFNNIPANRMLLVAVAAYLSLL